MKTGKYGFTAIVIGLFAFAWGTGSPVEVSARPKYKETFEGKYAGLAEQVNKVKCGVCHPPAAEEKKKVRNTYGQALEKALGAKNVDDKAAILKALGAIEAQKSAAEGKSFGDLIKAGELPGVNE
jgi:hypothetical protein